MLVYFVIASYPHVHWSSYLSLRTVFHGIVVLVLLSVTDGWHLKEPTSTEMATTKATLSLQPLWISITSGFMTGPICNIVRVAAVFGCQEMEAF